MAGACNSSVTITPMERAQAKQKMYLTYLLLSKLVFLRTGGNRSTRFGRVGYMKAQAAATIGLELDLSGIAPYVDQVFVISTSLQDTCSQAWCRVHISGGGERLRYGEDQCRVSCQHQHPPPLHRKSTPTCVVTTGSIAPAKGTSRFSLGRQ